MTDAIFPGLGTRAKHESDGKPDKYIDGREPRQCACGRWRAGLRRLHLVSPRCPQTAVARATPARTAPLVKPWSRLRAVRLYRDETNLGARPDHWIQSKDTVKLVLAIEKRCNTSALQSHAVALAPVTSAQIAKARVRAARYSVAVR